MVIPFTDREIENAWRQNRLAAEKAVQRSNAHRLLLFYAVECGLEAILMRRQKRHRTDLCTDIYQAQHNVNQLLDCLSAQKDLRLPSQLSMKPIKVNNVKQDERKFTPSEVNQMWRYGGCCSAGTTDQDIENKLIEILKWIDGELKRL